VQSAFVENLFEQGQVCYVRGQHEHGEAFVNDALGYYETIFGSVHPELGEAYRALANLYHRLAGQLSRRIQLFEASGALAKDEDRKRARAETGFADEEALKVAKAHYDAYCEQAIKLTRQAVIIAERTTGIDSHETLQCYSDLAIFESQVGNGDRALRCLQHAVALSNALYGDNHPEKAKAAVSWKTIRKPLSTLTQYCS
jgi:protein TIF31